METETMELTAENVEKVFLDCLFRDGEPTEEAVNVEGVVRSFGFHPARLRGHKADVRAMLAQLPDNFKEKVGGGWSFLNACNRANGTQWGEHANMEKLVTLGIALGLARWQMPKEMWSEMPGGMPYFVISD